VSVVTIEEQAKGWLKEINSATAKGNNDRQCSSYRALGDAISYLNLFQRANFDINAHECFLNLRKQGIRIGTLDLRIAAIALTGDFTLVTRNRKDFEQVPNLTFERWDL
jgi:tRNA(fMet)-specific endonuclease VapC